jgi:hypothetical protein
LGSLGSNLKKKKKKKKNKETILSCFVLRMNISFLFLTDSCGGKNFKLKNHNLRFLMGREGGGGGGS